LPTSSLNTCSIWSVFPPLFYPIPSVLSLVLSVFNIVLNIVIVIAIVWVRIAVASIYTLIMINGSRSAARAIAGRQKQGAGEC